MPKIPEAAGEIVVLRTAKRNLVELPRGTGLNQLQIAHLAPIDELGGCAQQPAAALLSTPDGHSPAQSPSSSLFAARLLQQQLANL